MGGGDAEPNTDFQKEKHHSKPEEKKSTENVKKKEKKKEFPHRTIHNTYDP